MKSLCGWVAAVSIVWASAAASQGSGGDAAASQLKECGAAQGSAAVASTVSLPNLAVSAATLLASVTDSVATLGTSATLPAPATRVARGALPPYVAPSVLLAGIMPDCSLAGESELIASRGTGDDATETVVPSARVADSRAVSDYVGVDAHRILSQATSGQLRKVKSRPGARPGDLSNYLVTTRSVDLTLDELSRFKAILLAQPARYIDGTKLVKTCPAVPEFVIEAVGVDSTDVRGFVDIVVSSRCSALQFVANKNAASSTGVQYYDGIEAEFHSFLHALFQRAKD